VNRYLPGRAPDHHLLPKWFPLAASVLAVVYALYLSFQIKKLRDQLPPRMPERTSD
jgi:uncharacterized membrane protein YhdT